MSSSLKRSISLCDWGLNTYSLDYSDQALRMTEQLVKGRSKLIQRDVLTDHWIQSLNERFDVIFSDGLFEHFALGQQQKLICDFASLLTRDGFIITFVPNRWSLWELIRPLYMPGIEERPFVLSELIALHKQAGLRMLQKGGINTLPFLFSPDRIMGVWFGMLLYVIGKREEGKF